MARPDFLIDLPHGITVVDTGFERERFDAAYLLVDGGRAAFIDTGHNAAVPRLLAALEHAGLAPEQVDWVIPTHVHLDHAGGAGLLMRHLPQARLLVHPRGAPHMIDPGALVAGATAVYGEEVMQRTYGRIEPVDEGRVVASHDGMQVEVGTRRLTLADTPGHARHHHCVWDEASRGWFTGDTFGISYREFDADGQPFIFATTTPVQFDPPALRASIGRLLARGPECVYLTHFAALGNVQALGLRLLEQIDAIEHLAAGIALPAGAERHAALVDGMSRILIERARLDRLGMSEVHARELLALDIQLNAQGIGIWMDRSRQQAAR